MTDDGFSGPDPALGDLPDEDVDEIVETIEEVEVTPVRSCDDCAHQDVCQLYVGFTSSLVNFMRERTGEDMADPADLLEDAPMQPADLAIHCDAYTPEGQ